MFIKNISFLTEFHLRSLYRGSQPSDDFDFLTYVILWVANNRDSKAFVFLIITIACMKQLCHAKLILELMNSTYVSSFNERAHMKIFTSLRRYIFKLILSSKANRKWFAEWNIWPMIQIWTCFIFQRIILRMREFSSLRETQFL